MSAERPMFTLYVMLLLTFVLTFLYSSWSPYISLVVVKFKGVDVGGLAAILTAMNLGLAVGPLFSAVLSRRAGLRIALPILLVLKSFSILSWIATKRLEILTALGLLFTVSASGIVTILTYVASRLGSKHGKAFGLFYSARSAAFALGPLFGGIVLYYYGYKTLAMVVGVLVACCAFAMATLRILGEDSKIPVRSSAQSLFRGLRGLLHLRAARALIVTSILINFSSAIAYSYRSVYAYEYLKMSEVLLGVMYSFDDFLKIFLNPFIGVFVDRFGYVRSYLAGVVFSSMVAILWPFSPSPLIAVVLYTMISIFASLYIVAESSVVAALVPEESRLEVYAVTSSLSEAFSVVAPTVGVALWELSPRTVFVFEGLLGICASIILYTSIMLRANQMENQSRYAEPK